MVFPECIHLYSSIHLQLYFLLILSIKPVETSSKKSRDILLFWLLDEVVKKKKGGVTKI